MKEILYVGNSHKNYQVGTKALLKGLQSGLIVYFSKFPGSMIRICIPNTNTDTDRGE
jgi:hypothetical protein